MSQPLRIAVADDEPDMRDYFRKILPHLGYQVVGVAANGRELVEQCRAHSPDVVLSDVMMPEMDGIDAAIAIYNERPVPILLVTAYHDNTLVERAGSDHVMGYLVKPIKQSDLGPAIALAVRRFEQFQALQRETADLRAALADRKVIDEAMSFLAKKASVDEGEAFRRLQEFARTSGRKLPECARSVLAGEDVLGPADNG
jgi:response regulator NasT